jgi:hypothetical protein
MFLGGAIVSIAQYFVSREMALRTPYLVGAVLGILIFIFAAPRLTTKAINQARADAAK